MTHDETLQEIRNTLTDLFGLTPEQMVPEALLEEDLDLDSIDAVDLVATMEKKIGRRIDIEKFHNITTLGDLMDVISQELKNG